MNRIVIFATPDCWMAKHEGPCAREVVELFGTDTLPLPFTILANVDTVLRTVRELNPHFVVEALLPGQMN